MFTIRSLKKEAQQQLKGHGLAIVLLNILAFIFRLIPYLNFIVLPLMICVFSYFYLSISRYETPSNKRLLFTYPGIHKVFLLSFLFFLTFLGTSFILVFFEKQFIDNRLFSSEPVILSSLLKQLSDNRLFSSVPIILLSLVIIAPFCLLAPYRQAINILIDQPSYSIIDALTESKEMMRGNKTRLLLLDFSYGIWIAIIYVCIYYFFRYTAEYFLLNLYGLIRESNADHTFRQALYTLFVILGPMGITILISFFQFFIFLWLLPRYFTAHANLYNEINDYTPIQYTEPTPTSQSSNDSIGKINYFE